MARVVLGVTGGIAAFKAVLLLRLLTKAGHDVTVVPTESALRMVGRPTFQALSGNPVHTSVFDDVTSAEHVRLGKNADLVVVAPATADSIARFRSGRGDDLLAATLLMATCPVVLAPAMHTEMWRHPATRENISVLRERGVHIIEPDSGELAGKDIGEGRLPEPEAIFAALEPFLGGDAVTADRATPPPTTEPSGSAEAGNTDGAQPAGHTGGAALAGIRLAVSAGGTREPIDPVRFIGNRSSGRQGIALARAAHAAGAEVTLLAANVDESLLAGIDGVTIERVSSTAELETAAKAAAEVSDVVVMAAAVADYRPNAVDDHKMKKDGERGLTLTLEQTPDILAGLVRERRGGQVIVGFAAETGDEETSALEHARAKARRKGADILVFNDVSGTRGFGDVPNEVVLLDAEGNQLGEAAGSKDEVAAAVVEEIAAHCGRSR